jgi:hypothetical protein
MKLLMEWLYRGFLSVYRAINGHEIVKVTDSVAFLVHVVDTSQIILVEQYRPAMECESNPTGKLLEVGAGRFDIKASVIELVRKEALEELGVDTFEKNIELINSGKSLALSPGVLTERQYLAYVRVPSAQVDPEQRTYGADHDESIQRVFININELPSRVWEDMKTFALIQWFLNRLRAEGDIR